MDPKGVTVSVKRAKRKEREAVHDDSETEIDAGDDAMD
jgi:hypothetical protein